MILTASGGLVYHARAAFTRIKSLTGSEDRWAPTRRSVSTLVASWLDEVSPDTLILVGPSAGYLLERNLFQKYEERHAEQSQAPFKIIAIDPDRTASYIFRARFHAPSVEWHARADLLPFTSADPEAFAKFLTATSQLKTAVLFLGVLGQIDLHQDVFKRTKSEACKILFKSLEQTPWASLHDLESVHLSAEPPLNILESTPPTTGNSTATSHKTGESESTANSHLSPPSQTERIQDRTQDFEKVRIYTGAWTDHETEWIGEPRAVIPWLLSPKRFHNLGFVTNSQ